MLSPEGYQFQDGDLTLLDQGTFSLSVPTVKDIVQINTISPDGRTSLSVELEKTMIVIQRQDGEPLQVEYRDHRTSNDRFIKVFRKPIQDLVLVKGRSQNEWTATGNDVHVQYRLGFDNLIDSVARYMHHKQSASKHAG